MAPVDDMVAQAVRFKQPAFASTDHGNMSAAVKGYLATKKAGIPYFPGTEIYVLDPKVDASNLDDSSKAQRYHLGLLARNLKGYQGLVKLNTLSHTRPRFNRFPRVLLDDLFEFGREYGNDWIITTGCVFGLVEKTLIDEGPDAARNVVRVLQQVTPNLFAEIQRHNIVNNDEVNPLGEDKLVAHMIDIANEFGLPLIATQDCHYLNQADKSAHNIMKNMLYGGVEDEFPGDSFHMCSTQWIAEKYSPEVWSRVEDASTHMLSLNELSIPQLDKYKAYVPEVSKTPNETLRELCENALITMGLTSEDYKKRLEYELNVIFTVGMSNYFLLVKQCIDFARTRKIPVESRGSANGSLVAYLLNITQVDAVKWNTDFDRFMAIDRVGQAPDVDIDIADKDRHIIIEYLDNLKINGEEYATSALGTYMQLGQVEGDEGGSAFNTYMSYRKKLFEKAAWINEQKAAELEDRRPLKKNADAWVKRNWTSSTDFKIKNLEDVKSMYPKDYDGLKKIIDMGSVYRSRGKHAGGILVSSKDLDLDEFIPKMLIPGTQQDSIVSQYTMKDVEKFGLLKMDWLGQTSLSVMSKCLEFLGKDPTDFTWIPDDDPKVLEYVKYRKNHPGIFHLEQPPKSRAMVDLVPTSTADFIIHQAYSMPGAVDSGAASIYLKRRKTGSQKFDYTHPILQKVFDWTLGVMLFQEQVLGFCRGVGLEGSELTNFFSIVKDSGRGAKERNAKRLAEGKIRLAQLAEESGLTKHEFEWAWNQMIAMGSYGFNLAHATGYGIRSYRTAYLKYYHTAEYYAALMYCWTGKSTTQRYYDRSIKGWKELKKYDYFRIKAREDRVRFLAAGVNNSDIRVKVENGQIRHGLLSLDGVGEAVASKIKMGQPYIDMDDFCLRSGMPGGVAYRKDGTIGKKLEKLINLDALDF